jgi:hypothetical protein
MPSPNIDMEDIPDLTDDCDEEEEDEEPYVGEDTLKGGHLFSTTIPCEAEFIWATSNVSQ